MRSDGVCAACGAEIRWVITVLNGSRIPIDPIAVPDGNVWVVGVNDGMPMVGMTLHAEQVPRSEPLRYVAHSVTCTASWKKKKQ